MPKKGNAIPIDKTWKQAVIDRIAEMKISQNEVARRANITKSSLSAALADGSVQTTVMPAIHRALEWPPPPASFTKDSLELLQGIEQLTDRDRGEIAGIVREKLARKRKPR